MAEKTPMEPMDPEQPSAVVEQPQQPAVAPQYVQVMGANGALTYQQVGVAAADAPLQQPPVFVNIRQPNGQIVLMDQNQMGDAVGQQPVEVPMPQPITLDACYTFGQSGGVKGPVHKLTMSNDSNVAVRPTIRKGDKYFINIGGFKRVSLMPAAPGGNEQYELEMKTGSGREGSYFSVGLDELRALASLLPTIERECSLLKELLSRHPMGEAAAGGWGAGTTSPLFGFGRGRPIGRGRPF